MKELQTTEMALVSGGGDPVATTNFPEPVSMYNGCLWLFHGPNGELGVHIYASDGRLIYQR
jgi:hypothetical protein